MKDNRVMRKPLFNPGGDTEVKNRRLINFNTTNINDFNPYSTFSRTVKWGKIA